MKTIAFTLLCLFFSVAEMHGQQVPKDISTLPILSQPLPPGDLIAQLPNSAEWVISSSLLSAGSATDDLGKPPPKSATVTVKKSGKQYEIESLGSDGRLMVRWKDGQYQATYPPGVDRPVIQYAAVFLYGGSVLYYLDFSKTDFPEFSWISARDYVGMTKLAGGMALVFKASVPTKGVTMSLLPTPQPSPSDAIAVIDLATRRPLMLQVGNEVLVYRFSVGAVDVSLPLEAQKEFDSFRQQIRQASQVPPG